MKNYRKVYPFGKSVFNQKFLEKTILPKYADKLKTAYSDKGKDRVFFGTLKANQFTVYTYPDMGPSLLNPKLFIRNIFILAAPSCIYGSIIEYEGQTIAEYSIDKTEGVRAAQIFGIIICCISIFMGIIDAFYSGIKPRTIAAFFIIMLVLIVLFRIMLIPQQEESALQKFMENLGE